MKSPRKQSRHADQTTQHLRASADASGVAGPLAGGSADVHPSGHFEHGSTGGFSPTATGAQAHSSNDAAPRKYQRKCAPGAWLIPTAIIGILMWWGLLRLAATLFFVSP